MQTMPDYQLDALFRSVLTTDAETLAPTASNESEMFDRVREALTRRRSRRQITTLLIAAALVTLTAGAITLAGDRLRPPVTPDPSLVSASPNPPSTAPSPSGAPSPCVEPTPSAVGSLSPETLLWTSERHTQDWPGPLRVEPPGCVPILVPASTAGEIADYSYHDSADDGEQAFGVIDIVDVQFRADCWFAPSVCVYFDMAADVPEPMPDPADQWIAYGIVVDTTGDGRPEFRYGIDNAAPDADGGRMWRVDLTTGSTYSPIGILEAPQVMDAVFPSDRDLGLTAGFNPGSVYAKRLPDQPVFRFYVWASVIVDGQIVATDYAPDSGWIELPLPGSPLSSPSSRGEVVHRWPDTTENPAGLYAWGGGTSCGPTCNIGFMHNGYGSGDVDITINVLPDGPPDDGGSRAVTVAGHDGTYRRINDRHEEWIVDIEGTTVAIRMTTEPGTSGADLAEAHAIIDSMYTEPTESAPYGWRLVFRLTTDDWDSG